MKWLRACLLPQITDNEAVPFQDVFETSLVQAVKSRTETIMGKVFHIVLEEVLVQS